jgi:organic hydroperoxide reductase OsmC/OhrA
MEAHYYNVNVAWDRDRRGTMSSPDFVRDGFAENPVEIATPPEFPKGVPGVWSPEHLLTAAVSSCFMTTFLAIADNSKLEFTSFNCHASGKLDVADGRLQMTEVSLQPVLVIRKPEDRERAMRVLAKTEAACLITHSIKAKVTSTPVVNVAEQTLSTAAA